MPSRQSPPQAPEEHPYRLAPRVAALKIGVQTRPRFREPEDCGSDCGAFYHPCGSPVRNKEGRIRLSKEFTMERTGGGFKCISGNDKCKSRIRAPGENRTSRRPAQLLRST